MTASSVQSKIKRTFISSKSLPIYEAKTALIFFFLTGSFHLFHLKNQDQIKNYLIPTYKKSN